MPEYFYSGIFVFHIKRLRSHFTYIYIMRFLALLLALLISSVLFSQADIIAKDYFKKGAYEKALYEYKKLYAKSPSNISYIKQIVSTYQQLEKYTDAEVFLNKLIARVNYPAFYVDLGYNFQLKKDLDNANKNYDTAINSLLVNANNAFSVAKSFQNYSLLDYAIATYEKGMELQPKLNFKLQLAQIYGEQGEIGKMFLNYLDFADKHTMSLNNIKRAINDFISEDGLNENNIILRKLLIKKIQQEPKVFWNEMLSWLFVQQKDYKKAFIQEKAILSRQPESMHRVVDLGITAFNEGSNDIANEIFSFVTDNAQDKEMVLSANYSLLQIKTKTMHGDAYDEIEQKYIDLFEEYGTFSQTLNLQLAYSHFLAFNRKQPKKATEFLKKSLKLPLTELQKAEIKLKLGDILVLQEQFNQALIYYTQIQRNLKNSTVSQEARFKVAKASYYKGDFKWAESQLKILKASTSQLIANDALDLKLLISDNKYEDSLQTALKRYAKADLLAFQNRNDEAIAVLDVILDNHKTEPIIAQTLFKQAELFKLKSQFDKARVNYELIIENYREGVLVDDAYYNLAVLNEKELNQPEKAKQFYEQIIFNHSDSIYFVDARKRFRALRGDVIN